jgi:uncharacterized delta-60 repeat protein
MKNAIFIIAIILIILPYGLVHGQPGFPDPSFKSGILYHQMENIDFKAYDIAIQADGKFVITGSLVQHEEPDVLVVRLMPDGTPDPEFGNNGILTFDLSKGTMECGKTVKILRNKILVAGNTNTLGFILRLKEDGSLDNSFAEIGYCISSKLNSIHDMSTYDVGEEYKIVLAGSYIDGRKRKPGILCYSSSGHYCPDYGERGRAQLPDDIDGYFSKISVAKNGNLYAIGTVQYPLACNQDALVAKFDFTGTLNTRFSDGKGYVIVEGPVRAHRNNAADLQVNREGYITVCGDFDNGKNQDAYIFRLTRKGVLDHEFGCRKNGYYRSAYDGETDEISSMVIQPDGRIIIGGSCDFKGDFDFSLVRLHFNGLPDMSFGYQSWQLMDFSAGQDRIQAMDILKDESIVAVGTSTCKMGEKISVSKFRVEPFNQDRDLEMDLAICRTISSINP